MLPQIILPDLFTDDFIAVVYVVDQMIWLGLFTIDFFVVVYKVASNDLDCWDWSARPWNTAGVQQ